MLENSNIEKKKTSTSASGRFSWIFCLELSKFVSHDILIGTKCQVSLYEFGEMLLPLYFQSASNNSQIDIYWQLLVNKKIILVASSNYS